MANDNEPLKFLKSIIQSTHITMSYVQGVVLKAATEYGLNSDISPALELTVFLWKH